MTVEHLALILAGFSIGVAAGESYLLILRRSLRKLIDQRESASTLWSAPARVAIPVLALALVAKWHGLALVGAVVGLLLTQLTAQFTAQFAAKTSARPLPRSAPTPRRLQAPR
ncbi:N-ATPase subunit AtpR [Enhygromyxa salina]|uniref:N-ATPase, AtpR subunit n=1 Tax=Enhygromyxa salina TaxID=215803 RepID=A0A2S9YJE3_9BACT|nr:ATP synthase subunit I [Enhygromyxa salina]PRQ05219.1 N-ATPase, AtpR subunit [Enhygromyxa salina]